MSYAYLIITHCPNDSSLMYTNDFLFFFVLYFLSVVYTVFVEELKNSILILIITVSAEFDFVADTVDVIVRTPQQVEERLKLGDFFIKRVMEKGVEL